MRTKYATVLMCIKYALKEVDMKNTELFFKQVEKKLNGKKIILVSGASSSGKSYMSNQMCKYFLEHNKKAIVFSADNYYKGLSRIIVQKAITNNNYPNYVKQNFKEICKIVKNATKNSPFTEKMCENNVNFIKNELNKLFDKQTVDRLVKDITYEFTVINFDEPFAVDLNQLAKHINILADGGDVIVPEYSFKTSEVEFYEKNKVSSKDFDVIIIEGIYVLRDEVLDKIDKNNIVKATIECDLKTLISRKLDRDLTKQRSTFSKEQIITSFLTQVMPSFFKYIYPTFKNSDISYSTSLTEREIKERFDSKQTKYLAIDDIDKYLSAIGASLKSYDRQTDYFLEDRVYDDNQSLVLRLREQNGLATSLTIKSNSNTNSRKIESYDLNDNFKEENRKIDYMVNRFLDSGFYVSCIVDKTRKVFEYNGLQIKVDKFDDKCYVEFENVSEQNQKMLKDKLLLGEEVNVSYYQMEKDKKENLSNQECEIKLKINNKIDGFLSKIPNKKQIFQTYLNLQDENTKSYVCSLLPKNLDISKYSEARIRTVSGKSYVTLKSKGGLVRNEYEKQIPSFLVRNLDKLSIKGRIKKDRYDIIIQDNIVVSIDNYLDRKLNVLEVEFDPNKYTQEEIVDIVKKQFPQLEFENVTNDIVYKNSSLAK